MDEQVKKDYQTMPGTVYSRNFAYVSAFTPNNPSNLTENPFCTLKNRNLEKTTCLSGRKKHPIKTKRTKEKESYSLHLETWRIPE